MNNNVVDCPQVSVIAPIYNVDTYIDSAVGSICRQVYLNNQIILVDDGSTDNSGVFGDIWCMQDERIMVVHKKNGGLSDARNTGLNISTGEMVYFIDGDDSMDAVLLSETIEEMREDVDMVAFGYRMMDGDNKVLDIISFPQKSYSLGDEKVKNDFLTGAFFQYQIGWNAWNRVFKRRIIEEHSIRFIDTRRIFAEDQLFCLSYLLFCRRVICLSNVYYNYSQRDTSIMGVYRESGKPHFAQKSEMSRCLFQFYREQNGGTCLSGYESVIHFLLIDRVVQEVIKRENYKLNIVKRIINEDIAEHSSKVYWNQQLTDFVHCKEWHMTRYSSLQKLEKTECAKWLLGLPNIYFLFCTARKIIEKR